MVDYLGLGIFLLGVALVVAELAAPTLFIGSLGTSAIIVGLVQMAWPDFLKSWWSPFVATPVALTAALGSAYFWKKLAPPARAPETLASDALVGQVGKVATRVETDNLSGKVKLGGIVWSAQAVEAPIPEGADVVVVRVDGVHLVVQPKTSPTAETSAPSIPEVG